MDKLNKFKNELLVSRSRVRAEVKISKREELEVDKVVLEGFIEKDLIIGLYKEFAKEKSFTIKKRNSLETMHVIYSTDVFMFDTKLFRDTMNAYICLLSDEQIKRIKAENGIK